ncbi:hypothetical protein NMG60_11023919 [Bertholletia excelsa]
MGRGVSSSGGQSSLGYLFGSGKASQATIKNQWTFSDATIPADDSQPIPAGIKEISGNKYFQSDGQNSSNFITDRPTTKVHAAPDGGSPLGYLFGGGSN